MKTAAYHVEGYGPGKSCHLVGEVGTTGPEGFVYVRRVNGRHVIATAANRGAVPDELLGRTIPCRAIVRDEPET